MIGPCFELCMVYTINLNSFSMSKTWMWDDYEEKYFNLKMATEKVMTMERNLPIDIGYKLPGFRVPGFCQLPGSYYPVPDKPNLSKNNLWAKNLNSPFHSFQ